MASHSTKATIILLLIKWVQVSPAAVERFFVSGTFELRSQSDLNSEDEQLDRKRNQPKLGAIVFAVPHRNQHARAGFVASDRSLAWDISMRRGPHDKVVG